MFPILFSLGPIEIHTASLILSIGLIVTFLSFLKAAHLRRLQMNFMQDNYLAMIIISLFGARIGFIIFNWATFTFNHPGGKILAFFNIWDKGMSVIAGIISFVGALILWCLRKKEDTWKWLDAMTIPLLLFLSFHHLGEFFEGQSYGKETLLPWGLIFEASNVKYTVPIHPTQLYAFLATVGIIIFLKYFASSWISFKTPGKLWIIGTFLYALAIFFNIFLRGDDVLMSGNFRIDQISALFFSFITLIAWKFWIRES